MVCEVDRGGSLGPYDECVCHHHVADSDVKDSGDSNILTTINLRFKLKVSESKRMQRVVSRPSLGTGSVA